MHPIKPTRDIQPVSEFRANAAKFLEQVRETKKALVITQHGKAAAVLLDYETYDDLVVELEAWRAYAKAEPDIRAGRLRDHDDVMQGLRARFGV